MLRKRYKAASFDQALLRARRRRRLPQARSARAGAQPGDLRHRRRVGARHRAVRPRSRSPGSRRRSAARSPRGCGSRCCSPTSPRPSPKGAGAPRPTRCARRAPTPPPSGSPIRRTASGMQTVSALDLRPGDTRAGRGRRADPRRRRHHRRRRLGQRGGHHRRVGARHPRGRRRPLGRHRRHHRALRLDRGAHHVRRPAPRSSTA